MGRLRGFRRIGFYAFLAMGFIGVFCGLSFAQDNYPAKPVVLNVAYAAGGSTDVTARAYAATLEKIWKQPVVVVNKPGGAGAVMLSALKSMVPDGYNIGVYGTGAITGPHLKEVPYDIHQDFSQLAQIASFDMGLSVNVESQWKTAKDLVEYGRKNPGKLRFSTSGVGSSAHLLSEQFGILNNMKTVMVPFAADSESTAALLGNHIDVSIQPLSSCSPLVKAGKLRMLLVFSKKRVHDLPNVPTAQETGYKPDIYKMGLFAICAPKNLPTQIAEKIISGFKQASESAELNAAMEKVYIDPTFRGGKEWLSYMKEGDAEEAESMRKLGLKVIK